jgi:hypothetical protein
MITPVKAWAEKILFAATPPTDVALRGSERLSAKAFADQIRPGDSVVFTG